MDQTETAPNINSLAHDQSQHENRDEAYTALKLAVDEYMQLMEQLHADSQVANEAGLDTKFAALDEAHRAGVAISGVNIKPI